MYITTNHAAISSGSTSFMNSWKVPGAPWSPIDITMSSNSPKLHTNADNCGLSLSR